MMGEQNFRGVRESATTREKREREMLYKIEEKKFNSDKLSIVMCEQYGILK